jgi:hypothetical protein
MKLIQCAHNTPPRSHDGRALPRLAWWGTHCLLPRLTPAKKIHS